MKTTVKQRQGLRQIERTKRMNEALEKNEKIVEFIKGRKRLLWDTIEKEANYMDGTAIPLSQRIKNREKYEYAIHQLNIILDEIKV